MRVILVGAPEERRRLRVRLDVSLDVVGEFASLAEARSSGVEADAIVTPSSPTAALDGRDPVALEPLTRRERQVLDLLAEGLPNKAIAGRLGISDQTVKFHVAAIAAKLGARTRTEAVRIALRRGLVTL